MKEHYKLVRKFDGKNYTLYGGGRYNKSEASKVVKYMHEQGYLATKIPVKNGWLVYYKR